MPTNWTKGPIDGVVINKLTKHLDERGFLCETFRSDELPPDLKPVMSYVSYTEPGFARGPHEHTAQTDIFSFIGPGNFKLKLWDNRPGSATYGHYTSLFCGADNPVTVIIPPGIVHGYKNISTTERGSVLNYPDRLFMGKGREEPVDEIRHEDDPESPFQMD
jgi:dTDP-4-dehydrorhamnose 3,5-epimerase